MIPPKARSFPRYPVWAAAALVIVAAAARQPAPQGVNRALALATFDSAWTRVRAMHYDSLMNGVDWDAVRNELRPKAEQSSDMKSLRAVLTDMLGRLGESHYTIIPRENSAAFSSTAPNSTEGGTPGDVGIEARIVGAQMLVTRVDSGSPAAVAGIRAGWALRRIAALDINSELSRAESLASPRATRDARLRLALRARSDMQGNAGSSIDITVADARDAARTIPLARRAAPGEPVRYGTLPLIMARVSAERLSRGSGCVGVIRFNTWMPAIAARIDRAVDSVRTCAGVIVDLRGNTGGVATMVVGITGHFLRSADTIGTMRTRTTTLSFVANPRTTTAAGERVTPYAGPLAILVDGMSASTTEIFAAAMQTLGRARIFGDTTAGQALPATTYALPNGDMMLLAVGDFRGPRGERVEGKGVVPDVYQPGTRAQLLAGSDPAFEAALAWLQQGRAGVSKRSEKENQ